MRRLRLRFRDSESSTQNYIRHVSPARRRGDLAGLTGVSEEGSASPDGNCGETTLHARPPTATARPLCWLPASHHRPAQCAVPRACRSLFSSTRNSWDMDCRVVVSRSVVSDSLRPHECSTPGSSVHGSLQARILEGVAMPSSNGSSEPKDQTRVSRMAGGLFTLGAIIEALGHGLFLPSSGKYTLR